MENFLTYLSPLIVGGLYGMYLFYLGYDLSSKPFWILLAFQFVFILL